MVQELGALWGLSGRRCPSRISCTRRAEVGSNFGLHGRQLGFPFKRDPLPAPAPEPPPPLPLHPHPARLRPGPSAWGPPCHLPCPSHVQSVTAGDRGPARSPTTAPRHGDRPQLSCPGRLRLPSMHFQAPAISELQPRGQSGRKKQEVWDSPSRGAGAVLNSRPCTRRYLALPRPQPLADFPGVRFGGWPELQKSRCVCGSFRHIPRVPFAGASPGFLDERVAGEACCCPWWDGRPLLCPQRGRKMLDWVEEESWKLASHRCLLGR